MATVIMSQSATPLPCTAADLEKFLIAAAAAARLGGEVLLRLMGQADVFQKGPGDWVTAADFESQKTIREFLLGQFSDHQFLGEEVEPEVQDKFESKHGEMVSQFRWIVDPLDGTTNYVHQLASFSVSVALQFRDHKTGVSQILVGTVFDPLIDECFCAAVGGGATLNGKPIRASKCVSLNEALTVFSMSSRVPSDDPQIKRLLNVLATSATVRRLGSAALNLCYVAAGRVDAYWATNLNAWDIAAGGLIATEAGAVMETFDGQPVDLMQPKFCCSATDHLLSELQTLLNVS